MTTVGVLIALRDGLHGMLHYWKSVIGIFLLGAIVCTGLIVTQPVKYEVSAQLIALPGAEALKVSGFNQTMGVGSFAQTSIVRIMQPEPITLSAKEASLSQQEVRSSLVVPKVTDSGVASSGIISVSAISSTPATATKILKAFCKQAVLYVAKEDPKSKQGLVFLTSTYDNMAPPIPQRMLALSTKQIGMIVGAALVIGLIQAYLRMCWRREFPKEKRSKKITHSSGKKVKAGRRDVARTTRDDSTGPLKPDLSFLSDGYEAE